MVQNACKGCIYFKHTQTDRKGLTRPSGLWCCIQGRKLKRCPKECKHKVAERDFKCS